MPDSSIKESQLLTIKNKSDATTVAQQVMAHSELINEILMACQHTNVDVARKAAWALSALHDLNKQYLKQHLNELYILLFMELPAAVERPIIRIIANYSIPEKQESPVFDYCLKLINHPNTAVANRAFALDLAIRMCKKYPELTHELALSIPLLKKLGSPGLLVKVNKIRTLMND